MDYISQKRIGFIVASPLSRGLLSGKIDTNRVFEVADIRNKWFKNGQPNNWFKNQLNKIDKIKNIGEKYSIPIISLAFGYILKKECVSTIIPGMKSQTQVEENIRHYVTSKISENVYLEIKEAVGDEIGRRVAT